ncbi:MAG: hypothetical protein ACK5BN_13075, partial [Planctomycetota bacterium]
MSADDPTIPAADKAGFFAWFTQNHVAAALMACFASVAAGWPRFVFFPTVDGDNLVVSLTLPQGTPLAVTAAQLA